MKLYCSKCGVELTHYRKAIPSKGHIFDLVEPHNCKGYAVEEVEDDKETILQVLENLKDLGKIIDEVAETQSHFPHIGDKRYNATSSAPDSLIKSIRDLPSPGREL